MFVVMAKEYDYDEFENGDNTYVYPARLYETKEQADNFIEENECSGVEYYWVELELEK